MITSRYEACRILGVSNQASEKEIKSAYKNLVKQYHPDSGVEDVSQYHKLVEAYEYLLNTPVKIVGQEFGSNSTSNATTNSSSGSAAFRAKSQSTTGARILGEKNTMKNKREEKEAFDRWYEKRKQEKKEEFNRRVEEVHQQEEKKKQQEEEYKIAMEAINNIILAETIKALIAGSDKAKEEENR